ncbi:interleukin-1 receptor type 1-like [Thunnus maccoyii]|uniref:interleukin-1 receptor type 1-like n=1 Tax=Thunnus maccoyii TaxID=8240 RepID=UPI001C4AD27D|nr:interleukin-1 receptor type 1-like [Thunnus maccoyii]XP_042281943.1 interleukin-1 receptor type 1-like [Thunnus maccoyii]
MDSSQLLFFILMVISASEYSARAEPACKDRSLKSFNLLEGESFHYDPLKPQGRNLSDEAFMWYKNSSQMEYISSDEKKRIHRHSAALFFLNLSTEDSGVYIGRYKTPTGDCHKYPLKVDVFNASYRMNEKLLYGETDNSDQNKMVRCPDPLRKVCKTMNGTFTWYKDFSILEGEHEADLWRFNASKDHEGIYTCICTWKHNHMVYNSSGSRKLIVMEPLVHYQTPLILLNKEQYADEGSETKLSCSVICGFNVRKNCKASWNVNGIPFNKADGYNQTINTVDEERSKKTISTAILTIERVSAKDFQDEFKCIGDGYYEEVSDILTLKQRETIIPLVIGGMCAFFLCVFVAIMVKCFAIDLALLFRPYLPLSHHNKDAKSFDAYVVYQMQSGDNVTEDTLCKFVTKILPSVLEEKCGYRLFIHGRDDIPGEDHLELVEDRMKQSRRLMVILTPGSGSGMGVTDKRPTSPQNPVVGGFDWQLGLHHALFQREMNVILIQLGDTGPQGYTHLPPGLQHLIRSSAPLRWPEGSRGAAAWNSRFWKRVRYLMPAKPSSKSPQSAII